MVGFVSRDGGFGVVKNRAMSIEVSEAESYATAGPLTRLFPCPTARVLDQAPLVGRREQTIPMLCESTNLSYKTVEKAVKRLVNQGLMTKGRRIGNANTYVFETKNHLSQLIACATDLQLQHVKQHPEG